MNKVLVVAEHDGSKLNQVTAKAINCGLTLAPDGVAVMVLGHGCDKVCEQVASLHGVTRVLSVQRTENADQLAAQLAPQIAVLATGYSHVLGPDSTFGKDLMPRVAALLGVPQISEVMRVVDAETFERPIYAGAAIARVRAAGQTQLVLTVRSASYPAIDVTTRLAPVETHAADVALPTHTRLLERQQQDGDSPDLQAANRVVTGGRGLGSSEQFSLVHDLAKQLGAAVGATRAAVDAGFASNDMQVGQTGKTVAPDLYLALAVSGAIQHLSGIKDAGTIVAINKDPDAPIFEFADIGLVADVFDAVPELQALLD